MPPLGRGVASAAGWPAQKDASRATRLGGSEVKQLPEPRVDVLGSVREHQQRAWRRGRYDLLDVGEAREQARAGSAEVSLYR